VSFIIGSAYSDCVPCTGEFFDIRLPTGSTRRAGHDRLEHRRRSGFFRHLHNECGHSIRRVFPDRQIEDIPDNDPIFHTLYDLDERFQVPGAQYFESGRTYEKGPSGKIPH
jgi:hypothetical protein